MTVIWFGKSWAAWRAALTMVVNCPAAWMEMTFDVSLRLDRRRLRLPKGALKATDILSGEDVDISRPVTVADMQMGRLIWVRRSGGKAGPDRKPVGGTRKAERIMKPRKRGKPA